MAPPKLATQLFLLLHLFSAAPFTAPTTTDYHHINIRDIAFFNPSHHHHHHHHHHNVNDIPSRNHTANKHELSLSLIHRDAVSGRSYGSHRDRIADLLSRDSARAESITRRLSPEYHVDDFGSEVVSGLDEGSGEYFVRVGVGSPPIDQYLVVDSGSDIIWVQCQPCVQCYAQSDPVFDPAESSSFAGVSCGSPICGLLRSDEGGGGGGGASASGGCGGGGGEGGEGEEERCRYEVTYGDGSYTRGVVALETLTFGGGSADVRDVAIGCGQRNRGLFVGAAGLLGLGWGPMSLVAQLGGAAGGAFSYCLVSRGSGSSAGSLVFGRTAAVPVGAVWVALERNPRAPSFYYVGVAGLGVGGARLPIPAELFRLGEDGGGGVVMDTGTAVTRLPGPAYAALRDAFAGATPELPRAPRASIFDTCYDLSGYESVRVPTVSFYFADPRGAVLTLPARNFLIPVDGAGTFCFAFAAAPDGAVSILGNVQQEGIQITVDAANGFVGFGPNTC